MATTDASAGFRLPWSTDATETDATEPSHRRDSTLPVAGPRRHAAQRARRPTMIDAGPPIPRPRGRRDAADAPPQPTAADAPPRRPAAPAALAQAEQVPGRPHEGHADRRGEARGTTP